MQRMLMPDKSGWDMRRRTDETGIASSTLERAKKRLRLTSPIHKGNSFFLEGLNGFGDAYDHYELRTDGKGTFWCSCYTHYGGKFREEKVCSHAAACALFFNLPCKRTLPLKKEPERPTPDRPCDIPGIPARYIEWRPSQREAVEWLLNQWKNNIRFSVLDAPTGSGKSLTATAAARLAKLKTLYVVSTRQLQEQVFNDYSEIGVVIWGREHYPCTRFSQYSELTASDCTDRRIGDRHTCPKHGECPYKLQKQYAVASDLAIVNYSFFLHEANLAGAFSGWPLVVFDEGDLAEDELMKFFSLKLTRHQLETCQIEPPEYKTKFEAWLEWSKPTLEKVSREWAKLEAEIDKYVNQEIEPPVELTREYTDYSRLRSKLIRFTEWVNETWVAELDDPGKWEFKPTWVNQKVGNEVMGETLWGHGKQILAMSATMLSAKDWAQGLGIKDKVAFHRVPSYFPKENRPIIYLPTADFSQKAASEESIAIAIKVIDGLLDKHENEKGLIHTVSYKLTRELLNRSRHQNRLISHNKAGARAEALEQLVQSQAPLVLVSPSFGRGIDLFGNRARFQICVKIPFLDLGDKQTKKRRWSSKAGERWYTLEALRSLVQMCGRIVRSADDWGITYILDERFPRFILQMKRDCPQWFLEAIQW